MIKQLPPKLAHKLADYQWEQDSLGHSRQNVYRLQRGDEVLFLKTAVSHNAHHLQAEVERMNWLNGRLPVPIVRHFEVSETTAFLLMTAVSGHDFTYFNSKSASEKGTAVRLLAEGLRQLHSLPIADCPFAQTIDMRLQIGKTNMEAGFIDEEDFDEERVGRPATELYEELLATCPAVEERVFTHGDYCLPNVMLENGRLTGFIDLGLAGIADPYQDLALCSRSLTYNFGAGWEEKLFFHYGLTKIDTEKVAFYRLLDEFF